MDLKIHRPGETYSHHTGNMATHDPTMRATHPTMTYIHRTGSTLY
jgi:hypothetical protein